MFDNFWQGYYAMMLTLLICLLSVVLVGAYAAHRESKREEQARITQVSDLEVALLAPNYPEMEISTDRGLLSYQAEGLQQLRAGMEYMEAKYPSYTVEYESFESMARPISCAVLHIKGTDCMVQIENTADGYVCSDNFYGQLIQGEYDEFLSQVLELNNYTASVCTKFTTLRDNLTNEDSKVQQYLENYPDFTGITEIYLSVLPHGTVDASELKLTLRKARVYGSYIVYYVDGPVDDLSQLMQDKLNYPYVQFTVSNT